MLTLDHVYGGGAADERQLGSLGGRLYRHLKRSGFPPGFQVLCYNCNVGKYRNDGTCPLHQNKLDEVAA
jgi:hypothetical protein